MFFTFSAISLFTTPATFHERGDLERTRLAGHVTRFKLVSYSNLTAFEKKNPEECVRIH